MHVAIVITDRKYGENAQKASASLQVEAVDGTGLKYPYPPRLDVSVELDGRSETVAMSSPVPFVLGVCWWHEWLLLLPVLAHKDDAARARAVTSICRDGLSSSQS